MTGRQILLDHMGDRQAAALVEDGKLHDLFLETDLPAPGTIYRAVADRPMKAQGGMFLKTPDGSAFLRQVKGLAPGQTLLVQVSGFAEEGKATPVTSKLLFKSRYVIVTPDAPGLNISRSIKDDDRRDALLQIIREGLDPFEYGMILRSSCADADDEDILEDAQNMLGLAGAVLTDQDGAPELLVEADNPHTLGWREWTAPADVVTEVGCFETHGVLDMIEDLQSPAVRIEGGHYYVEPTRAFVTVDVNTGKDTSPAAGIKANIAMARDLPRQLRLRGLGGRLLLIPPRCPRKIAKLLKAS